MMNPKTYSVDSKTWLMAGDVVFYLDLENKSTFTTAPANIKYPLFWVVPLTQGQYRVRIEGNEGFHILLNSGEKFSSDQSGIFVISKRQLDLLQAAGVAITVLGSSGAMRDSPA
jgi:hypothetical protein